MSAPPARRARGGSGPIGLLYALPLERVALMGVQSRAPIVERAGVGSELARSGAERALAAGAGALVSVGFCGAARAELVPGDVVVATEVIDAATWAALSCDTDLTAGVRGSRGPLETRSKIARTPDDRGGHAIALDMESAAIGQVAAQARVPFAAVRAVSDSAQTTLPPAIDETGVLHLGALRPADVPHLLRLGTGAGRAILALRRAVRQLVRGQR